MLFHVDVGYPHQMFNKHECSRPPADHQSPVSNRAGSNARESRRSPSLSFFTLSISRHVLRPVHARAPFRFVDVSSAARNPMRHERHRRRGAGPGGERAGETGEDVFQTGRVQAGKPGGSPRTRFLRIYFEIIVMELLSLSNYYHYHYLNYYHYSNHSRSRCTNSPLNILIFRQNLA